MAAAARKHEIKSIENKPEFVNYDWQSTNTAQSPLVSSAVEMLQNFQFVVHLLWDVAMVLLYKKWSLSTLVQTKILIAKQMKKLTQPTLLLRSESGWSNSLRVIYCRNTLLAGNDVLRHVLV